MASSGSVELLSYQDALERVLTWLLEAEEVIDKQSPIADNVHTVKDQFNQHEVCHFNLFTSVLLTFKCSLYQSWAGNLECISYGELLTIKHILLTCPDLIEIGQSHFTAQSLLELFQEILPEKILKEINIFGRI